MYENQPGGRTPADIRQILGTDCDDFKPRRLCQEHERRPGRLLSDEGACRLYGWHDPASHRGQPCPGSVYGGRIKPVCAFRPLRYLNRVWKQLDQAINGVVDSITLADLVEEQKKLDGDSHDS